MIRSRDLDPSKLRHHFRIQACTDKWYQLSVISYQLSVISYHQYAIVPRSLVTTCVVVIGDDLCGHHLLSKIMFPLSLLMIQLCRSQLILLLPNLKSFVRLSSGIVMTGTVPLSRFRSIRKISSIGLRLVK